MALPGRPPRHERTGVYPALAAVIVPSISGMAKLHGADIEVPDLRGGFSHLIAALTAEGRSTVSNVGIIARGYENFITKLELLGADFALEG